MGELRWSLIDSPDKIGEVIQGFGTNQLLGFDFETTGLDYVTDEIHGMGIAVPDRAWYVTLPALRNLAPWIKAKMEDRRIQTVGHNTKFDLHFLKKLDPKIKPANLIDTMIAQWLVDENDKLGLKYLAEAKLGIEGLLEFKDLQKITKQERGLKRIDEVTIYDIDLQLLGKYGALDPWLGLQLWPKLQWELVQQSLYDYYLEIEIPFIYILQHMEETGFYVYDDRLAQLKDEWETRRNELLEQWNKLTKDNDHPEGRNPNSVQQLGEWFHEINKLPVTLKTKGGAPSMRALAITRLSHLDETGSAKILLEYKKLDKLLSTYIYPFMEKSHNNYLHGNYNQTGTVTGRLASNNPNLQNIPAHGDYGSQVRTIIGAPPGSKYLMSDYSQMELRLAAHYAKVKALEKVFNDPDGDPHQTTADLVQVERYIAKNLNFAWFYGAGPTKLCDMIEEKGYPRPTLGDAKKWFWQFGESYPELVDWKFAVLRLGQKLGYVRTIAGRRRHLPELTSYNSQVRSRAERQAVNSIIQGSSGDLIKWAMLQIYPHLHEYDARMNSQVHDELGFIVPDDAAEDLSRFVKEKMEAVREEFNIRVPIIADPVIGQTWAETKE